MKLRILGNSVRLRLTQIEVQDLAEGQTVREITHFGLDNLLEYKLMMTDTPGIQANFQGGKITIELPKNIGSPWAKGSEISLRENIQIKEDMALSILIEKDFKCKTERVGENEDDMFPNPEC